LDAVTRTSTSLLEGLLESSNEEIWQEFDRRYRPIVFAVARKLGLDEDEAADTTQETLLQFLRDYRKGKYDRSRGRLRAWIVGIVRHRALDVFRSKAARPAAVGDTLLQDVPGDDALGAIWEAERRQSLVRQALAELRDQTRTSETTIRAFELFVVEQQPAQDVARQLGLTAHDVYMAKNRVADRLRDVLGRLEVLFNDG
jgi:RNA polymerase sigma-70 factor (ECF subfamily)